MKLKTKFRGVIFLSVIQLVILSAYLFNGALQLQRFKDYQILENQTHLYISQFFLYSDAGDLNNKDKLKASVSSNLKELSSSKCVKIFSKEINAHIKELDSSWKKVLEADKSSLTTSEMLTYYKSLSSQTALISNELAAFVLKKNHLFKIETLIFVILVSIIISILIGFITRTVTKRIIKIKNVTEILADKNYSAEFVPEGSKEMNAVMTNINKMVDSINYFFEVVKTTTSKAISSGYAINDSANSTAAATAEIDANINKINEQFMNIKDSVNIVVQAISEMNLHVDTLVENNSNQTEAIADSNTSVKEVVQTLNHINGMAEERAKSVEEMHSFVSDGDLKLSSTSKMLEDIAGQLDEITEVVTIINSVAEQTNLLSMNAAIESAHAGEAGKGFAVVAEEIRNLAEETTENSEKIGKVISKIVSSVKDANALSTETAKSFSKIATHADSVISAFKEISGEIKKIDEEMQQIKYKSDETASAASKINSYCGELADKQKQVSTEVTSVSEQFKIAMSSIEQIKNGTEDILLRMRQVTSSSKESYKNMTILENVLEEFKTKASVEKAEELADKDNTIMPAELQDFEAIANAEAQMMQKSEEGQDDSIEFNLDDIEEYVIK